MLLAQGKQLLQWNLFPQVISVGIQMPPKLGFMILCNLRNVSLPMGAIVPENLKQYSGRKRFVAPTYPRL